MAKEPENVAAYRRATIARFLDVAQWVSGDYGFKVPAPAANKDVEMQRIGLLEYAADVLEAVRDARQADRQDKAPDAPSEADAPDAGKPKAKAAK